MTELILLVNDKTICFTEKALEYNLTLQNMCIDVGGTDDEIIIDFSNLHESHHLKQMSSGVLLAIQEWSTMMGANGIEQKEEQVFLNILFKKYKPEAISLMTFILMLYQAANYLENSILFEQIKDFLLEKTKRWTTTEMIERFEIQSPFPEKTQRELSSFYDWAT